MAIWHLSRGTSGLASASWAQAQAQASCCMGLEHGQNCCCSDHPSQYSRWGPLTLVGSESWDDPLPCRLLVPFHSVLCVPHGQTVAENCIKIQDSEMHLSSVQSGGEQKAVLERSLH